MYLLDTCTLSDYVKVYSQQLNTTLMNHDPAHIFLSAITIEEIEFGFHRHPTAKKKLNDCVQLFLETITQKNILVVDAKVAKIAGKIRANLQNTGKIIGQYDILIAATALANDKILVTSNIKHFSAIPYLSLENWR
jgi:tRNA(fMet)-specific endonuclease VapC